MTDIAIEPEKFEPILGIRFFNGPATEAVDYISQKKGYAVVPAAPALANIQRDQDYCRALVEADLAIADSGFMVLLWRVLRRRKVTRISGLKYLRVLLQTKTLRERRSLFLILPSEGAGEKARRWLWTQSFDISENECYVAPLYGRDINDPALVSLLNSNRPSHVIVGIGGGTQEKLGRYLREKLEYRPAIHCVGAALGFLTGDQKPIPMWADRLFLGWLLRLLREPRLYGRRFLRAFELPRMIWRYGAESPGKDGRSN